MGYVLLDLLKNEPKLLSFVYEVECPKFNIRYPRKIWNTMMPRR